MASIIGHLKRIKGKDVSADILSNTYKGQAFIPYQIIAGADGANVASPFRGIVLINKAEISTAGDPDGEKCEFTLT